jgi:hypothetical protein
MSEKCTLSGAPWMAFGESYKSRLSAFLGGEGTSEVAFQKQSLQP